MTIGELILFLSLFFTSALAVNSTDDWITVERTDIFKELDPCAQSCVRNVNGKIWDEGQKRMCQSYGCVCSESTQGPNFLSGQANVTSCAKSSCSRQEAVDQATLVYGDICLVQALNSSRPSSTPESGKRRGMLAYTSSPCF
jgi:hypothetical protein